MIIYKKCVSSFLAFNADLVMGNKYQRLVEKDFQELKNGGKMFKIYVIQQGRKPPVFFMEHQQQRKT